MGLKKTVNLLGATGSVGLNAVLLLEQFSSQFETHLITGKSQANALADLAKRLNADVAHISDESQYEALKEALRGTSIVAATGETALQEALTRPVDVTINAISGFAGLRPAMMCLSSSKVLALANKETLVVAGSLLRREAEKHHTKILPVDSEHNGLFQLLEHQNPHYISTLILTASGGPFRGWSAEQLKSVQPAQALKHPTWSMGAKITIDSATLMNKGLELIEAVQLFGVPESSIDVVVHPQSLIHAGIEFIDGTSLLNLSAPDMKIPLAHALAWPEKLPGIQPRVSLAALGQLIFEPLNENVFKAISLARSVAQQGDQGGSVIFNAANEILVDAFLHSRISFPEIVGGVEEVLQSFSIQNKLETLEEIMDFDAQVRRFTEETLSKKKMLRS